MSYSYDSMTYIGVYAGHSKVDAENYLVQRGLLEIGELDDAYGGDIQAMSDCGFPLNVQCENYLNGRGWYIGFETHPSAYKDFDADIAKFKELTGDDAEVITFTQVN